MIKIVIRCAIVTALFSASVVSSLAHVSPDRVSSVASGLVAWWPADGNARDMVGGHNGILKGGATFAPGKMGQAFRFNGKSAFVEIPFRPSLNLAQVSVAFWMKGDPSNAMNTCCQGLVDTDSYDAEISAGHGGAVGVNFAVSTDNYASFSHTSDQSGGGHTIKPGVWYYIVGTYDDRNLKLYIDGRLVGTTGHKGAISPIRAGGFLSIGSEAGRVSCDCSNRYFNGLIDDVRLYNRALSASEIGSLIAPSSSAIRSNSPTTLQLLSTSVSAGGRQTALVTTAPNAMTSIVISYPDGSQQDVGPRQAGPNGRLTYVWRIPAGIHGIVHVTVDSAGKVTQGSFMVR